MAGCPSTRPALAEICDPAVLGSSAEVCHTTGVTPHPTNLDGSADLWQPHITAWASTQRIVLAQAIYSLGATLAHETASGGQETPTCCTTLIQIVSQSLLLLEREIRHYCLSNWTQAPLPSSVLERLKQELALLLSVNRKATRR